MLLLHAAAARMTHMLADAASRWTMERVSPVPLGMFRMGYGLLLVWCCADTLLSTDELEVKCRWASLNFRWWFAPEWLLPRPNLLQAQLICCCAACAAALVAAGPPRIYRTACLVLFVCYTTLLLIEKTRYNNHYYLDVLLVGMLGCTDADRSWSLLSTRTKTPTPTVGAWQLWVFRIQVLLVYVLAGAAKLQSADWLWRWEPMTGWLRPSISSGGGAAEAAAAAWWPLHALAGALLPDADGGGGVAAAAGVYYYLGGAFSLGGLVFDLLIAVRRHIVMICTQCCCCCCCLLACAVA
jgi:hypothetical protein